MPNAKVDLAETQGYLNDRVGRLVESKGQDFVDTMMILNNLLVARDASHTALAPVVGAEASAAGSMQGFRESLLALTRLAGDRITPELLMAAAEELKSVYEGVSLFADPTAGNAGGQ